MNYENHMTAQGVPEIEDRPLVTDAEIRAKVEQLKEETNLLDMYLNMPLKLSSELDVQAAVGRAFDRHPVDVQRVFDEQLCSDYRDFIINLDIWARRFLPEYMLEFSAFSVWHGVECVIKYELKKRAEGLV